MGRLVTITDKNWTKFVNPVVDGEKKVCGTLPRDFKKHYLGYGAAKPFDVSLVPESEYQDRLDEIVKNQASLYDVRKTGMYGSSIPARDQGQKGYCWAHSTVSAVLLARATANLPYRDLSAYAIACMIKGFRDEGGWGSESVDFVASKGCPTSEFWPQQSMDRANDNSKTWANAKETVITEWMDLDPKDMERQLITCLLLGFPLVTDFNWWSHSVCTARLKTIKPLKTTILNSWGNKWSDDGMGDLEGNKALPDAALALRVIRPAA